MRCTVDKWEKVVTLHRILTGHKRCISLPMLLDRLECSAATFHRIRSFMRDSLGAPIEFGPPTLRTEIKTIIDKAQKKYKK